MDSASDLRLFLRQPHSLAHHAHQSKSHLRSFAASVALDHGLTRGSRLNERLGLGQRSHRFSRAQEILLMKPFIFYSLPPTSNLARKQKAPAETKTDGSIKALSILVSAGASLVVVSSVTLEDIASRFSGGHFGCLLITDLSACVSSLHSVFICATYRELTFMRVFSGRNHECLRTSAGPSPRTTPCPLD